jgi:hypothetical protein
MPRPPVRSCVLLAHRHSMSIPDFCPSRRQKLPSLGRFPSPDSRYCLSPAIFLWTRPVGILLQHIRDATGICSVTNTAGARAPLSLSHRSVWRGRKGITRDRRRNVAASLNYCHGEHGYLYMFRRPARSTFDIYIALSNPVLPSLLPCTHTFTNDSYSPLFHRWVLGAVELSRWCD